MSTFRWVAERSRKLVKRLVCSARQLVGDIARVAPLVLREQHECEHYQYQNSAQESLDARIGRLQPLTNMILSLLSPLRRGLAAAAMSAAPVIVYASIAGVMALLGHGSLAQAFAGPRALYLPFLFALSLCAFIFIDLCFCMLSTNRFWIISFLRDRETLAKLGDSLDLAFRPVLQIAFSAITSAAVAFSVLAMTAPSDPLEWCIALWWIWVMGFLVGNGLYWSLLAPQAANFFFFAKEVEYDPMSPATTPGLRCLASILGMAAVFDSVVVTVILYVLRDSHFPHAMRPAAHAFFYGYLAVGVPSLVYAFFYPLVSLSRLVIRLKRRTEHALLAMRREGFLSFEREQQIRGLLETVRSSPDVPHFVRLAGRLLVAFMLPVGALLLQAFLAKK